MTIPKSTTLEIQIGGTKKLSIVEKAAFAAFQMLNDKDRLEIDALCQALVTDGKTWRQAFDTVVITGFFASMISLENDE